MSTQPPVDRASDHASRLTRWVLAGLVLVPLLLIVGKAAWSPGHDALWHWCSLTQVPTSMIRRMQYVLVVPMGAAMVVFCRLSLGIRVLGPFRPVLIGEAFHITGIGPGLGFLVAVIAILSVLRPALKVLRLSYFGRVSVLLSAVSVLIIFTLLLSGWFGVHSLRRMAYFPIVVICLTTEGFARTLSKEGWRSAVWRGGMTVLVALLIAAVISRPEFLQSLRDYPELLLAQVGLILAISRYGNWRLLERLNPERQSSDPVALGQTV